MFEKINQVRNELQGYSQENLARKLPLLNTLLQRHYDAQAEVDIERARYMTQYFRQTDPQEIPMPIKRAEAVASYLSNRKIVFHDNNRLAGATTSKSLGAPLYPEFFGLSIWPELGTISTRKDNPQILSKKDADILNFEVFPYWMDKSISEEVRKVDPQRQALLEKMIIYTISKAATISHTTPAYELVLEKGIKAIMDEAAQKEIQFQNDTKKSVFYQSVRIAMQGILDYAANISEQAQIQAESETDPERKENLLKMAQICKNVPVNPPRTYHEAVNSLWICQVCVFAENSNMAINPGRIDQLLYPYFIKDYNAGLLTVEEALNISGSLWLKLADNVNLVPQAAEKLFGGAGAVPAV
ncbi:MAG TPA: pyruvate formate lyase family protein, partial [Desulfobacter postgatei]|nr:pyruvate formate lyase family protein [Desulfobacter postgatei]